MATQQIDEYYESLAYWKQQALDHEQALRDIKYNTIMNMTAEIEQLKDENNDLKRELADKNKYGCCIVEHGYRMEAEQCLKDINKQLENSRAEIAALKSKLKIASAALEVVKVHNGINSHYPIAWATVSVALSEIGGEI